MYFKSNRFINLGENSPIPPTLNAYRMYVSFLYFHQLKSTFEVDEMMQIKDQFVFTKLIHFPLMNVTDSEGGRRG